MDNIHCEVSEDEILTVTIDLKRRNGPSKATGMSVRIASSEGSQCLHNRQEEINFNVWIKKKHNTRGEYTE